MSNENETRDTDGDADETRLRNVLREGLGLNRRDVMKVAGGVGLLTGAGNANASEHTCDDYDGLCDSCQDTGCDAKRGACTPCLGEECEEIPDSRLEAPGDFDDDQQCVTIAAGDIPPEATHAAIKAANDCHECVVHANATEEGQTFCVSGQHGISPLVRGVSTAPSN